MTTTYLDRMLDPWLEFDRLNRLFENSGDRSGRFPAVNVWVNGENAVITSELPGITKEDIDISISGNTVTLKGLRPSEKRTDTESYHRHELRYGEFSKTIKLPFNIDGEKVKASYDRGILQISLPQLEADKPRTISVS